MKKTLLSFAALSLTALGLNACSISALNPEPVPLAATDMAHFTIDNSAIPAEGTVCGEKYKKFNETLRNGFNYAANQGENASVVGANVSQSQLTMRSLEMTCLGKDKFAGYIITGKVEYSWKTDQGPETIWTATVVAGSEKSVEKALGKLVADIYDHAFSTYVTNSSK